MRSLKLWNLKLYNYIMMPAMILSWIFGLILIGSIGFEQLHSTLVNYKAYISCSSNNISFFFGQLSEQI